MNRRDLIAASAAMPALAVVTPARASDEKSGATAPLSIAGVGLPVIADGRVRNYVFVSLRLHLGGSATAETLRPKEAYFRDALVRAAHRTPFTIADDWTRLNERALSASLLRAAVPIAGRGAVTRVEIVAQSPRRRSGVRAG